MLIALLAAEAVLIFTGVLWALSRLTGGRRAR